MSTELLLLLHAGATLFMTGLIWFVQWVHYPLFLRVGEGHFHTYSQEHQSRSALVVGPIMLLEVGTAIGVVLRMTDGPRQLAAWIGLGLLALIWLSTALVQVPLHRRLLSDYDPRVIMRLVDSNWFRTIAWTLRSAIALWLLSTGAST